MQTRSPVTKSRRARFTDTRARGSAREIRWIRSGETAGADLQLSRVPKSPLTLRLDDRACDLVADGFDRDQRGVLV